MSEIAASFLQSTVHRFRQEYLPRLRRAVDILPREKLWWRPHDDITSVGNLLLHLEGNVRQWIVAGIGGEPDHRQRSLEFAAREGGTRTELVGRLDSTVDAACGVIEGMGEEGLLRSYRIQGNDVGGLEAVYHVLEHFGWHTGQIVWIAKCLAGAHHGLAFYDQGAVNRARNG